MPHAPLKGAVLRCMRHSRGTNWTPRAVAGRLDAGRGTVKSIMYEMESGGALERVDRGLYRIPVEDNDPP